MGFKIKTPSIGKWNPGKSITNLVTQPGKELKNFGENQLSWTTGGWKDAANAFVGKKPPAPSAGEDPNVTALRNRLFGEAGSFEQDLPGMLSSAHGQIDKEGNQAMKTGLKGARQNFNRRGLLYSGLREGGEQDVRGRVAGTMAQQKAQSNKELTDMAKSKWEKAAQVGLQGYQDAVNREAEIADVSFRNQVARAQAMQQLGGTLGQIGGSMYGSRGTTQPTTTTDGGISSNYTPSFSSDFRNGNLRGDTDYYNNSRIPF